MALAWRHFAALARRGRTPERYVTTQALRGTQAVKAGRRLAGCERPKDVLSPVAQVPHGFAVGRLPDRDRAPTVSLNSAARWNRYCGSRRSVTIRTEPTAGAQTPEAFP